MASSEPVDVVVYARFSPRPHARECDSSEKQIEDARRWCDNLGYSIIAIHADDDKTGKRFDKRPEFHAALENCTRGRMLLVRDIKRFGRSLELFQFLLKLQRRGVRLATIEDGEFDLSDPDRMMVIGIKGVMGAVEALQIGRKTKEKMLRHQGDGRRMSNQLPYGFEDAPDSPLKEGANGSQRPSMMRRCESEQAIIATIRELAAQGLTPCAICTKFNKDGVLFRGGKWHPPTMYRLFAREKITAP